MLKVRQSKDQKTDKAKKKNDSEKFKFQIHENLTLQFFTNSSGSVTQSSGSQKESEWNFLLEFIGDWDESSLRMCQD